MTRQKGICEECKVEYEYEYNPKFPRKYCPECSAKKKQEWEAMQEDVPQAPKPATPGEFEVVRPGEPKVNTYVVDMPKPKVFPKDPVGLAVDIFCALINNPLYDKGVPTGDVMDLATDLVKRAQKELS